MKISNDQYTVNLTQKGGEIASFYNNKNNKQYIWQGDDNYWGGSNPTLFPIVGNTFSKQYEIDGKIYQMKNHGLIRYATLDCIHHAHNKITFELQANQETLAQYPFHFNYQMTYTLRENVLMIDYQIKNCGETAMPFTIGTHPGFNVPLYDDEKFEDYVVKFEKPELLTQLVFDPNQKNKTVYKELSVQTLPLDYQQFDQYKTLIFEGMKSNYIQLIGKHHQIEMGIKGYPIFALWTPKKDAPFVCMESWFSHADFESNTVPFEARKGMMTLKNNEIFHTSYYLKILD